MTTSDYETVLRTVRQWPPEQRFGLVQEVLKTLAPPGAPGSGRAPTLARARGLLAAAQPPPSDAEVERWLDERRTERYGS